MEARVFLSTPDIYIFSVRLYFINGTNVFEKGIIRVTRSIG